MGRSAGAAESATQLSASPARGAEEHPLRRLTLVWKRSQQNCLAGFQRVTHSVTVFSAGESQGWCFLPGEEESIEIVRRTGVRTFPPWAAKLHYADDDSYEPTAHMLILFSYLRRMFKKIRIQMIDDTSWCT